LSFEINSSLQIISKIALALIFCLTAITLYRSPRLTVWFSISPLYKTTKLIIDKIKGGVKKNPTPLFILSLLND
jgi:hypothetical protein